MTDDHRGGTNFDLPARRRRHRQDEMMRVLGISDPTPLPVLDCDRDESRVVVTEHGSVEPLTEETDSCVAMPVRVVISQGAGLAIEVGVYEFDEDDVEILRSALASYDLMAHRIREANS